MKHNLPEPLGHNKGNAKRKVYSHELPTFLKNQRNFK
jgi:hypothetical protein